MPAPSGVLSELYVAGSTQLPLDIAFKPSFHWFGEAGGGFDYGTEADAVLAKKINDNVTLVAKYAHYFADEFSADTRKFILQFDIKF